MNLGFLEILVQLPLHTRQDLHLLLLCYAMLSPVPIETHIPLLTFALAP